MLRFVSLHPKTIHVVMIVAYSNDDVWAMVFSTTSGPFLIALTYGPGSDRIFGNRDSDATDTSHGVDAPLTRYGDAFSRLFGSDRERTR